MTVALLCGAALGGAGVALGARGSAFGAPGMPDGSVDDVCDTGKVSFRISDPNVLAGKTSDGAPSVLELGSARTQIKSLLIPWTADCKSGESMWNTARLSGPLQATGAFEIWCTVPGHREAGMIGKLVVEEP